MDRRVQRVQRGRLRHRDGREWIHARRFGDLLVLRQRHVHGRREDDHGHAVAERGVVPNSTPRGPLGAGNFSFEASYSGDANYGSASSSCENFTVSRAAAATSTVAFDTATNTTWSGTEVTGRAPTTRRR